MVAEAWAVYYETGHPADERIARLASEAAGQPTPPPRPAKQTVSTKAQKRRLRNGSIQLDPNAPILSQARDLVR